jgi:uncharacterized protein YdeI (YjbR/CyaY-like superfamily)
MTSEVYVASRAEWRAWLEENSKIRKEVWLIYYRNCAKKPSIPYDDSVEEAVCFGWVDGVIKKLDGERYARKFMPRRPRSRWSESNKRRAMKMVEEGRMTEAGLATIREAKRTGEWFRTRTPSSRKEFEVPTFMQEALGQNERASVNFYRLADSYRRLYVLWVSSAKREETRKKRLTEAIGLLEQGKKLGLK